MPKKQKKPTENVAPFQLPELIKLNYQQYYLKYINEFASEVGSAIKQLSPQCIKLFGTLLAINENRPQSQELRYLVWRVFNECVWKHSRSGNEFSHQFSISDKDGKSLVVNSKWLSTLSENNKELKQILEKEAALNMKMELKFKSLSREQLDQLRRESIPYFSKPIELIDDKDLQLIFKKECFRYLTEDSEEYRELSKLKYSNIEPLLQFQKEFDSLLEKFCLEEEWLAMSVFEAIWSGTEILKMDLRYMDNTPEEIIIEIKNRLSENQTVEVEDDVNYITPKIYADITIPPLEPFFYNPPYSIDFPLKYYEKKAVEAYRQHLRNYLNILEESYKKFGYKLNRRPYDYTRLLWLVWWNIKQWTLEKILQEIGDTTGQYPSQETITKAFKNFKEYDLPLRK